MFITSAFAQTAPAAAAGGDMQSSLMSMLPLVLMGIVLGFTSVALGYKRLQTEYRTQQKKAKKRAAQRSSQAGARADAQPTLSATAQANAGSD